MSKSFPFPPFHANATWLPSGERLGAVATPGYAVSGTTAGGADLTFSLSRVLKRAQNATATISARTNKTTTHLVVASVVFVVDVDSRCRVGICRGSSSPPEMALTSATSR